MKKGIIILSWILLTIFYCWNTADLGRSMGENTNSAIEKYSEMMVEYGGTTTDLEHLGSAIEDMYCYKAFDDLGKTFKTDFLILAVTSVIYLVFTIGCYHFLFVKNRKTSEQNKENVSN